MSKISKSATMSANNLAGYSQPEYQLKYRITGAIVLMVLAVVVIPILLSEPSLEANNDISGTSANGKQDFKSRIVPLNIDNINKASDGIDTVGALASTDNSSSHSKVIEDTRPALLDLTRSDETRSDETRSGETRSQQSSAVVLTVEDKPASAPPDTEKPATRKEPEGSGDVDVVTKQTGEPADKVEVAAANDTANNNPVKNDAVKDGWVVRVGTYSRDSNVVSVSSLLSNSGYQPNKTSVSTSLGPSTRVWLGPFANRKTADEISDKLKALTGEKGYVIRSSS